jgi:hypothetical protein
VRGRNFNGCKTKNNSGSTRSAKNRNGCNSIDSRKSAKKGIFSNARNLNRSGSKNGNSGRKPNFIAHRRQRRKRSDDSRRKKKGLGASAIFQRQLRANP